MSPEWKPCPSYWEENERRIREILGPRSPRKSRDTSSNGNGRFGEILSEA